jgi:hypothetical protein
MGLCQPFKALKRSWKPFAIRSMDSVFVTRSDSSEEPESRQMNPSSETPLYEMDFKQFVRTGIVPIPSDRSPVLHYIHKLRTHAAIRGDYVQADYYTELKKRFLEACLEKDSREAMTMEVERIDNAMYIAKKREIDLKKSCVGALQESETETGLKLRKLMELHKQELAEFDREWESVETLRRFSKPSARLTELRQKEKRLLLIKEYEEALAVGKYADKVEQEEIRAAQARAESEAIFLRQQILRRHAREIQYVESRGGMILTVMRKSHDEKLQIIQNLQARIAIDKLNVRRPRGADTELISKMGAGQPIGGRVLSPRSQKQFDAFRKTSVVSGLTLKPVKSIASAPKRSLRLPKYHKKPLV